MAMTDSKPALSHPRILVRTLDQGRLERTLVGLYISGHESVQIDIEDPEAEPVIEAIDRVLDRLAGSRLEREERQLLVRFDPSPIEDPLRCVDAMRSQALEVLEAAVASIHEPPTEDARRAIDEAEEGLDRELFRLLRANTLEPPWQPTARAAALGTAERLERIGDYGRRIAERSTELSPQERVGVIADRIEGALETTAELVDAATQAVQRPDLGLAHRVVERSLRWSRDLEEDAVSLVDTPTQPSQLPGKRLYRGYFSILEDTQRIGLYAKSIAEMAVNRATMMLTEENAPLTVDAPCP